MALGLAVLYALAAVVTQEYSRIDTDMNGPARALAGLLWPLVALALVGRYTRCACRALPRWVRFRD